MDLANDRARVARNLRSSMRVSMAVSICLRLQVAPSAAIIFFSPHSSFLPLADLGIPQSACRSSTTFLPRRSLLF